MSNDSLMVDATTVGGETIQVSYREARRVARSLERCNERVRELRAAWYAENGLEEGVDLFAVFD